LLGHYQRMLGAPEQLKGLKDWAMEYAPTVKAAVKPSTSEYFEKGWGGYAWIAELGKRFKEAPVRTPLDLGMFLGLGAKVGAIAKAKPKAVSPTPEPLRALFHQTRNRVKHPLAKQTIDEIYDAWGERGALEGMSTETLRKSGFWKLSTKDRQILTKYRLGKLRYPLPHKLRVAAEAIDEVFSNSFKLADEVGVKVKMGDKLFRPVGEVKNYVPRTMKKEIAREIWDDVVKARKSAHELAKDSGEFRDQVFADIIDGWYRGSKFNPRLTQSIKHLIKTKQAKTPGEAVAMMDEVSFNELFRPFQNIERPRALRFPLDFYETDMGKIMASYIHGFAKRIPEIKRWGQGGEQITNRLRQITKEGFPEEGRILKETVASFTGTIEKMKGVPPAFRKFTEGITAFEVGTKIGLGTATIPQFTQPTISFIPLTRTIDWVRGGARMFSKAERSWARETGAPGFEQIRSITGMRLKGVLGAFAETSTKVLGFQQLNKGLQYWAVNTAKSWLPHLHKTAQSKIKIRRNHARRQLKDWGIDPDKPLTDQVLKESSYRFAMDTQLQRNMMKEPLWMNNPRWRWLGLFKRFGYRQFNLVKDHMIRELKYGNPLPMLKLMTGGALGGEAVIWAKNAIRSFLTGRPYYRDEDSVAHRIINDWASVGTVGWVTDVGRLDELTPVVLLKDAWRLARFQATPVVASDLQKSTKTVTKFIDDLERRGWEQATRRIAPQVTGLLGGVLANYVKERLKTPEQFKDTMNFFKRETRKRAMNSALKKDYDRAWEIIEKWNYNNPDYSIDYFKWNEIEGERKRRRELRQGEPISRSQPEPKKLSPKVFGPQKVFGPPKPTEEKSNKRIAEIRKERGPELAKFIEKIDRKTSSQAEWNRMVGDYVRSLPKEAQLEVDTLLHHYSMQRATTKPDAKFWVDYWKRSTAVKVKGLEILDYKETDPKIIEKTIEQFKKAQKTHAPSLKPIWLDCRIEKTIGRS